MIVRSLVRRVLRAAGYNVIEAPDAQTALNACAADSPYGEIHLLITDVVMPDLTGPQLAARAQTMRPSLRVLFMSGYTDGAMQEQVGPAPQRAFLQKPFTAEQLCEKVREMLDTSPADDEQRSLSPPPPPPQDQYGYSS